MTSIRAIVVGIVLVQLAGCSATIRLIVSNQMAEAVSVQYADSTATIGGSESDTLIVPAISLPLQVSSGAGCVAFELPLAGLPGEYYKPGLRHAVEVTVVRPGEVRIEPVDREDHESIVVSATDCKA